MKHESECKVFDGYLKEKDNGLSKLVKATTNDAAVKTQPIKPVKQNFDQVKS